MLKAIKIKGVVFGCKEFFQALIPVIFFGEGFVLQGVAQGQEQLIAGGGKVWTVWLLDDHIAAQLKQLLVSDVSSVGYGLVVKEADGPMVWTLVLNWTSQTTKMLAVQLRSDADVG